ncbi:MAG: hypothetical protein IJ650_00615 [Paludibacteraceae bacterium]|nr:hypothetical protein [Paludibacteraceae bacterium]
MNAQPAYECNFEDQAENAQWELNYFANQSHQNNTVNRWYIGSLDNYGGRGNNSLYISADNGNSISYSGATNMIVTAVRALTIPRGNYLLCFNWMVNGKPSGSDAIYVYYIPDADNVIVTSGIAADADSKLKDYALDTILAHSMTWQYAQMKLESDGSPGRLVFVWRNTQGNTYPPGPRIDNIEILPEGRCDIPRKIAHSAYDGVVTLSWNGGADFYQVISQDYSTGQWFYYDSIPENQVRISGLTEGMHFFSIRAYCGIDKSPFTQYSSFIVYEGARCIDYLSLHKAVCYAGSAGSASSLTNDGFDKVNAIDHGYASIDSRHTIHYITTEYDPRTADLNDPSLPMLKTVPDNEIGSVRLGNWRNGSQAERIEYKYVVEQGTSDILKVQYAVVLESPSMKHSDADQSHFTLNILDGNGNPIGNEEERACNSADFAAGYDNDNVWYERSNGSNKVFWKDWTTISISLRRYIGQTLTIRLTTSDCTQGGHYGYAYFTLACETGELRGLACSDEPITHFEAPEGFNYRWYREDNPSQTLSTEQTFDLKEAKDTMQYVVDVISKTNNKCKYELYASSLPHNPKAVIDEQNKQRHESCRNYVTFHSKSHMIVRNDQRQTDKEQVSDIKINDMVWDFGDGSMPINTNKDTITHAFPAKGGQFKVTLYAYTANRQCVDKAEFNVSIPNIEPKNLVFNKQLCGDDTWSLNNKIYSTDTIDSLHYTSWCGCDSIIVVNIKKNDNTPVQLEDTICYRELPYQFNNGTSMQEIRMSGTYTGNFRNRYGCDSIVTLNLEVLPFLEVLTADTVTVCVDGGVIDIPYVLSEGILDTMCLTIDFSDSVSAWQESYCFDPNEPIAIKLSDNMLPGRYPAKLQYKTATCPFEEKPLWIEIGYPASVLSQKGQDGWVGLLDAELTGYKFTSYQWYRDGELIEGANLSYLPVTVQDEGHSFSVVVTREGESVGISTCPVIYGNPATAVEQLTNQNRDCEVYNVFGTPVFTGNAQRITNLLPGNLYIIKYTDNNETVKFVLP